MATPIEDLIRKYVGDDPPAADRPPLTPGNRIEALINGPAYFAAMQDEIDALINSDAPDRYFYLSAWWLGLAEFDGKVTFGRIPLRWEVDWSGKYALEPFEVDGEALLTRLKALAGMGCDVRVMSWCMPYATTQEDLAERAGFRDTNGQTLLSTQRLRDNPALARTAILNLLAHPLGGAHLKCFVCGDGQRMQAYLGGLDPVANRLEPTWHDVGVRVEGPSAESAYRHFQQLWNEQVQRKVETFYLDGEAIPSHFQETPRIPDRVAPLLIPPGDTHVQSLRTVPRMVYAQDSARLPVSPGVRRVLQNLTQFERPPLSFAPNGLFEFRDVLRRAIAAARRYVFIADQSFYSAEVMDWINLRLLEVPTLKVILLYGIDPFDEPQDSVLREALDRHLIRGLPRETLENIAFYAWEGTTVHAKVTLIDDEWCAIGSANCMRRSLYTDLELSVAVVSETFAMDLRHRLWVDTYCVDGPRPPAPLPLDSALALWQGSWGRRPAGLALHPELLRKPMPQLPLMVHILGRAPQDDSPDLFLERDLASRQNLRSLLDGYADRAPGTESLITTALLELLGEDEGDGPMRLTAQFEVEVKQRGAVWLLLEGHPGWFQRTRRQRMYAVVIRRDVEFQIYSFFSEEYYELLDPDSRNAY